MKLKFKSILPILMAVILLNTGCDEKDPPLPDNILSFAVSEIGFEADETSKKVSLTTSRVVAEATQVVISVTEEGVAYGEQYTTEPAIENGRIMLTIPAGKMDVAFTINKVSDVYFEGTEKLQFTIEVANSDVVIDEVKTAILHFGAILSQGDMMTIQGKLDANDPKVEPVYIDFSQNEQYRMAEKPYTLGFYCGDDFRVILNNTDRVKATFAGKTYETTKTDINAVTLADADEAINIGADGMATPLELESVDDATGKLEGTVFRQISENPNENKVYLVAIGTVPANEWYKVKVNRKDNGYSVQYALINESDIKAIDIEKDKAYNIVSLDLVTGKTLIREPKASKWDILYSTGMNVTEITMGGGPSVPRPYFMQDLIFINNLVGVEAAEVSVEDVKYEVFSKEHLKNINFSSDRNIIGSNWRVTAPNPMNPVLGIKYNLFYIIKDSSGNYYKLRFLKMGLGADGGVRGRPEIEYALVR